MAATERVETHSARKFLAGSPDRLRLALAVEEAVELLREKTAEAIYPRLRAAIGHIPVRHKAWKITDECKQYKPLFWRRLYVDRPGWKKDQFAGVSVGRWKSERLGLEVCAEGWPSGDSSLDLAIRSTFARFVTGESAALWREDEHNSKPSRRVSWHFDGDRAFLIGDMEHEVERIASLMTALVETIDKQEAST